MKIIILPEYPLPILCGGIEIRSLRTLSALQSMNIDAQLINYFDRNQEFDILHLFGNPASWYEICYHIDKSKKIVISTVFGAEKMPSLKEVIAVSISSNVASLAHQKTDYLRLKYVFSRADHLICLNRLEMMYLMKKYNVPEGKISIINNAVKDSYFKSCPNDFTNKYNISDFVLYVGNITKRKNPLALAKVLQRIKLKGVFIGQSIGSEGDYHLKFKEVVDCSPNIIWIKGLPHDHPLLLSAYAAAKVFCLPSISETQPQSALEAMAAGNAIILGDFPYAYQTPFEEASKVNPDDIEAFTLEVKTLMNTKKNKELLLPKEYLWENVACKIGDVYSNVCS